jgi:TRAP-type mannitol/chloroaromatic compound transport system permease large subunit
VNLRRLILRLEGNRWVILAGMVFVVFVMGMSLDPGGIILLAVPLFSPIVESLGFDLIWFSIIFIMTLQTGYLTPPFGFNLFYMKSVVSPDITMKDIYRAIIPWTMLMLVGILLVMLFPQIVLWIPSLMK